MAANPRSRAPGPFRRQFARGAAITPFQPSEKDLRLLALRQEGLWASEIAARIGARTQYIDKRLRVLRRRGVPVPPALGPRPNAWRRVSDEAIVALAQESLQAREIAARVGLGTQTVRHRLERLRERGILPGERRSPRVSAGELAYYRAHFREAVREDGVICLECGRVLKALAPHVRLHALTLEEYKAQWGYNRSRALLTTTLREVRRQVALAHDLPGAGREWRVKGGDGDEHAAPPPRLESRLDQKDIAAARMAAGWRRPDAKASDDALRALAGQGLNAREIAGRLGRNYQHTRQRLRALGLRQALSIPVQLTDVHRELLALRAQGLWASEIASRTGLTARSVAARLKRLQARGVPIPRATRPRPNAWRRVHDDVIIALSREGLKAKAIAVRVGLGRQTVRARIERLRGEGLLPGERRKKPLRSRRPSRPARGSARQDLRRVPSRRAR